MHRYLYIYTYKCLYMYTIFVSYSVCVINALEICKSRLSATRNIRVIILYSGF